MTKTIKNAIQRMQDFNPYKNPEFADTYNDIYNAMFKLYSLQIITSDDFDKIVDLDHKMYNAE